MRWRRSGRRHPAPGGRLTENLTARTGAGARWGLLTAAIIQASTIVSMVAASRLLTPSEFAIVAATTVVFGLAQLFTAGGFGMSVITAKDRAVDNASTVFWAALAVGTGLFAISALTAPLTARLIGTPEAAGPIAVQALVLPLIMTAEVLAAVQLRALDYRKASTNEITTAIGTSVLPVILLFAGWGPWAIIVSRVAAAAMSLVALLIIGGWRPRFEFHWAEVRQDARFQSGFLGSSLLNYVGKNADYWVLGRVVSAAAFSAYYIAFTIPILIRQRITTMAQSVLAPALTKVRDDPARLLDGYERITRMITATLLPAMVGLAITADLVLRIAFGPEWSEAVSPMRILAMVAAVDAISTSANSMLIATRRSGTAARRAALRAGVLCLCLVPVFWIQTIDAAAWAVLASAVVAAFFTQVSVAEITQSRLSRIVPILVPPVVACLAMTAVLLPLRRYVLDDLGIVLEFVVVAAIGAATYGAVLRVGFGRYFADALSSAKVILKRG